MEDFFNYCDGSYYKTSLKLTDYELLIITENFDIRTIKHNNSTLYNNDDMIEIIKTLQKG